MTFLAPKLFSDSLRRESEEAEPTPAQGGPITEYAGESRESRHKYWNKEKLIILQKTCRERELWPGGDRAELLARLLAYEFEPAQLTDADWAQEEEEVEEEEEEEQPAAAVRAQTLSICAMPANQNVRGIRPPSGARTKATPRGRRSRASSGCGGPTGCGWRRCGTSRARRSCSRSEPSRPRSRRLALSMPARVSCGRSARTVGRAKGATGG